MALVRAENVVERLPLMPHLVLDGESGGLTRDWDAGSAAECLGYDLPLHWFEEPPAAPGEPAEPDEPSSIILPDGTAFVWYSREPAWPVSGEAAVLVIDFLHLTN